MTEKPPAPEIVGLTASIVAAYLAHNPLEREQVPALIGTVYQSLAGLGSGGSVSGQEPAVPIKQSVTPDYIVCLEDGKRMKMLKRYIRTQYGLTPDAYRRKWGLAPSYPMVAPNYAKVRSAFAKKIGLGTKRADRRRK